MILPFCEVTVCIMFLLIFHVFSGMFFHPFLSTNGSMQRLKIEKNKIFKKIENKLITKKMLKSKNIIPIIKFLFTIESDILTGSMLHATNLESLNNNS